MSKQTPYTRFQQSELILRDELAIDRTLLANERTLLAYLRSAIALVIGGLSIMHFAHAGWFRMIGIGCIPFGILTGGIGVVRYRIMDRQIAILRGRIRASRPDDGSRMCGSNDPSP